MENMTMVLKRKENPCSSSGLGMHKDSQRISKVKPKIRIIHIFAPEIIKTDVENFRELVQRLTGKPSPADLRLNKNPRKQKQQQQKISTAADHNNKKAEQMVQIHEVKEEEEEEMEMWNSFDANNNSAGGFLSGFSDLDGFIQELGDFSMMNPTGSANHFHAFPDSHLA